MKTAESKLEEIVARLERIEARLPPRRGAGGYQTPLEPGPMPVMPWSTPSKAKSVEPDNDWLNAALIGPSSEHSTKLQGAAVGRNDQ